MNPSPQSALEERIRQKDANALGEYLQLKRPQLLAFIERNLGDALRRKVEADDIFQEVSVDCVRSLPEIEQGIVDLIVASITSPSQAFSRDQREFRLQQAIEQLPEESRRAIEMRYAQGLPTKDIAQQLGKSDGAVRVLLTRTVKKLQQLLG